MQDICVKLLSNQLHQSFEGLTQATRVAKKHFILSPSVVKQHNKLDVCYNVLRHTDAQKGMQFIELLDRALRGDAISNLTRPPQSCSSKSFSGCSEPIYDSSEPAESESGGGNFIRQA